MNARPKGKGCTLPRPERSLTATGSAQRAPPTWYNERLAETKGLHPSEAGTFIDGYWQRTTRASDMV